MFRNIVEEFSRQQSIRVKTCVDSTIMIISLLTDIEGSDKCPFIQINLFLTPYTTMFDK